MSSPIPAGRSPCDTTAALLVGGLGTRLRSVLPSMPKPLAPIGQGSFLELLILQLRHQGVRRLVMCTGHLGDQIELTFGSGEDLGVAISYSREQIPMGTAGALKLARRYLESATDFIVLNGDSFIDLDFAEMVRFHKSHQSMATLAVRPVENTGRYGTVQLDSDHRVTSFLEKTGSDASGLVNTGVYVFNSSIFDYIEECPASLERDVFPRLLGRGLFAVQQHGVFVDIGTPSDYARAREIWSRLHSAALGRGSSS